MYIPFRLLSRAANNQCSSIICCRCSVNTDDMFKLNKQNTNSTTCCHEEQVPAACRSLCEVGTTAMCRTLGPH